MNLYWPGDSGFGKYLWLYFTNFWVLYLLHLYAISIHNQCICLVLHLLLTGGPGGGMGNIGRGLGAGDGIGRQSPVFF